MTAPETSETNAPQVILQDDGAIRVLTLSNPRKKNALTRELLDAVQAALPTSASRAEQPIRVVILTGDASAGAFSSGYDITAIDEAERERGLDPIRAPADAIEQCPVPVIAAINGHAFGGAFELAMACHLRVATPAAKLGMPPAKLGLVYSVSGLTRFLRAASPSVCNRLFLVGAPVSAEEALSSSLVDALAEDAVAEAKGWARAIAANAPLAVTGLLEAIRRLSRHNVHDADRAAVVALREGPLSSKDLQEGVRAFVERRPPVFVGE